MKMIFTWSKIFISASIVILLLAIGLLAADQNPKVRSLAKYPVTSPIVPNNWKIHKIGTLWTRVTNFGWMGDDTYLDRDPSCDWPGGSSNSYLYRGSIWLTARVDNVVHSSQGDYSDFAPLDSVSMSTGAGCRSEEDTYTRYYDVLAPLAERQHFPLGVEIVERTYAWSASYADDFIVYEYTIKNVGIDTNGDGLPDTPRDLQEFYFTIRFDADVSRVSGWPSEYRFECWDDHVMSNGNSWDWLANFPNMASVPNTLKPEDCDSTMIFMFDGENPDWPADNNQDDDFGNPGPDGTLQSPGFVGVRVLKTVPYMKPSSFHQCNYYNDPKTDKEAYDRMIGKHNFEGLFLDSAGKPYAYDYRGILTFGPIETFKAGDSVKITAALGVGCDPQRGGVYSLQEFVKIMKVAKLIVDSDYSISQEALTPPAPSLEIAQDVQNGVVKGIKIIWGDTPMQHKNFMGFKVWKSKGKTAAGSFDWKPIGLGVYTDTTGSASWPPPPADEAGKFMIIDRDFINGFDYYYAIQSFSIALPEPFGVLESNLFGNLQYISPAAPPAQTLDQIKVVPNPYVGSTAWNNPIPSDSSPWQHRLQFIHLPADATIKIFTLDGDFVDEIQSGEMTRKDESFAGISIESVAEWDLITRYNQEAAPGMYIYVVKSPSLGTKTGKFVIIR